MENNLKGLRLVLSPDLSKCLLIDELELYVYYIINLEQTDPYCNRFTHGRSLTANSLVSTFSFLSYYNVDMWPLERHGSDFFSIRFGEPSTGMLRFHVEGDDVKSFPKLFQVALNNVLDDSCNYDIDKMLVNFDLESDTSEFFTLCMQFNMPSVYKDVVPLLFPLVRHKTSLLHKLLSDDDYSDIFTKLSEIIAKFYNADSWTLKSIVNDKECEGEILPIFGSFANTKLMIDRLATFNEASFVE